MADYPLDDESLSQTSQTVFDVAQPAVNLAVAVLNLEDMPEEIVRQACDIVYRYGDWENIPIPTQHKLEMMKRDFEV